jgi:hypothetical protein
MRLIDANDYRKRRCRTCINRVQCDNGGNLCFDIMVLNTCPTIEAEPVVRCKDCKYRQDDDFCGGRGWPAQLVPDDGYCDRGARMDGDSK